MRVLERYRRPIFFLALTAFLAGIGWSTSRLIHADVEFHFWLLVPTFLITVPLSVYLSTLRFQAMSWLSGDRFCLRKALEVVVLGAAANVLPLPGGVAVRVQALHQGRGYRKSVAINFLGLMNWAGVVFIVGGSAVVANARGSSAGGPLTIAGFCALLLAGLGAYRMKFRLRAVLMLIIVQVALTIVDVTRLWLCSQAVGYPVPWTIPAVLSMAGVAGSVVGFVPAGLGVTEVVGAFITTLLGFSPALGFIVTSVNRVILWAGILPISLLYITRHQPVNSRARDSSCHAKRES